MTNNFDIREWRIKQLLKESNQPNIDITTLFNNIFIQKQDIAKKYGWNSGRDIMFAWKEDPSGVKEVLRQGNTDLGPAYQRALDYYASQLKEQPAEMIHNAEHLEEDDWMQANDESDMAHGQLYNIKELATKLCNMIKEGDQLDAWVQAKLTKAEDYLDSVYHYLEGEEHTDHSNYSPEVILGTLNEVHPNDLEIGKSYQYTGTVPGGSNKTTLIFKGIKKYNQGKDHYYFTDDKNTGALLSYDDIINKISSIN